ncbi:MAG: phenylacetic acid degradation protein PaaY [Alphaproteobacteria bacterium]|nr:phenylacetic acid degradation protein PaaY [Alphaproteobacteria bacterium]
MPIYEIDGLVPVVDPSAFVHPQAVLIGDVVIGPNCYVAACAVIRGDFGRITIERGSNIQDNCIIHCFPGVDVLIEEDGHIGHGAILHGCTVKRNAMVGMNAVVMDGAVIGESSFVAALAFVKAAFEVPARTVVGGVPAKVLRALTDDEIAWKHEGTRDYQVLARRSHASLKPVAPLSAIESGRKRLQVGESKPKFKTRGGTG